MTTELGAVRLRLSGIALDVNVEYRRGFKVPVLDLLALCGSGDLDRTRGIQAFVVSSAAPRLQAPPPICRIPGVRGDTAAVVF